MCETFDQDCTSQFIAKSVTLKSLFHKGCSQPSKTKNCKFFILSSIWPFVLSFVHVLSDIPCYEKCVLFKVKRFSCAFPLRNKLSGEDRSLYRWKSMTVISIVWPSCNYELPAQDVVI